jgi:hypothetical protein
VTVVQEQRRGEQDPRLRAGRRRQQRGARDRRTGEDGDRQLITPEL